MVHRALIFREGLQSKLAAVIFPTKSRNWYNHKGYKDFEDFKDKKFTSRNQSYQEEEWQKLEPEREFINSKSAQGDEAIIDLFTLRFKGDPPQLPGKGRHIINFFGKGQNYERSLPEVVKLANNTGATVHSFNYPGMYESTGKVREFNDLINSGISVVNRILEKGINPADIILQGNCMGAAVAQNVAQAFKDKGIKIRVINSNSFISMKSFITKKYKLSFASKAIDKLLDFTGWKVKNATHLKDDPISPYSIVLNRSKDKFIPLDATLHSKIAKATVNNQALDNNSYIKEYTETLQRHTIMESGSNKDKPEWDSPEWQKATRKLGKVLGDKSDVDTHLLPLSKLVSIEDPQMTFYTVINKYLEISNKYIDQERQPHRDSTPPLPLIKAIDTERKLSIEEHLGMVATLDTINKANSRKSLIDDKPRGSSEVKSPQFTANKISSRSP